MHLVFPLLFACSTKSTETGDTGVIPEFETERLWSSADDWEPSVAASGTDVYQITTRIGEEGARTVMRHSADQGATWGEDVPISPEATDAYDPQIAVATEVGCLLTTWLDADWQTYVQRSCDHGETWSDPVSIAPEGGWTDHAWLLVSPDGEDVALVYGGALEGDGEEESGEERGYVVLSHDGGASFEHPIDVSGPADEDHYWFTGFGARGADGALYFTAQLYGADYTGQTELHLWRSTDGGESWDTTLVATSEEAPGCEWADGCEFGYLAPQMAVAVDVAGTVLVAWHSGTVAGATQALYVATSTPETWPVFSEPLVLSSVGDHAFPMATAGPEVGDFRLIFMADESEGGTPWNTWYQQSTDGGVSWLADAVLLSNRAAGPEYKSEDGFDFPYGDYNGIAVDGEGLTHTIWGEGPSWNGPGGSWYTRQSPTD